LNFSLLGSVVISFFLIFTRSNLPEQRGKVSFVGVFDKFLRPGVIPHFSVAIGWKNGKGEHKFKMKLLDSGLK